MATMGTTYKGVIEQMPIESLQGMVKLVNDIAGNKNSDVESVFKEVGESVAGGLIRNVTTSVPVLGSNMLKQLSKFGDPAAYQKMDIPSFVASSMGYTVMIPEAITGKDYKVVDSRGREKMYYPGDQNLQYAEAFGLIKPPDEIDLFLSAKGANFRSVEKGETYENLSIDPSDPTSFVGKVKFGEDMEVMVAAARGGGGLMNDFLVKAYPALKNLKSPVLIKRIIDEANAFQKSYVRDNVTIAVSEGKKVQIQTDFDLLDSGVSVKTVMQGQNKEVTVKTSLLDLLLRSGERGEAQERFLLDVFDLDPVTMDEAKKNKLDKIEALRAKGFNVNVPSVE